MLIGSARLRGISAPRGLCRALAETFALLKKLRSTSSRRYGLRPLTLGTPVRGIVSELVSDQELETGQILEHVFPYKYENPGEALSALV